MPIVEAVLQELVSAEDEQLVAGNSSIEEAEPISTSVEMGRDCRPTSHMGGPSMLSIFTVAKLVALTCPHN
ncbi:hypothetical protein P7K49_025716 [Saguinus oedipus]|uniref:Uncharacterized protein n=1 Tax=Saguinus oedipus TaxID=9490 RepID=A0ABQ9UK91_SAGOE|nr:hypothetical protein P7K49_025716 [Saguinus oedipus]